MGIRVAQWGTGTAGLRALRCVLENPALELVGLHVARGERAGRDAASFVDLPESGVIATNDPAELLASGAQCLVYMGSFASGGAHEIIPFLEAGIIVVTPTLQTLLTPQFAPARDFDPVAAACLAGGASFLSSGASPGFCTDVLPLTMLGIVDEIRQIRIQEIADYTPYPVQSVARAWGFGGAPGDPVPLFEGNQIRDSWESIPRDIARRLGIEIEEIRVVTDSGAASRDIEASFFTIPKGRIANIRFEVQGLVGGHPFVVLEHVNWCDYDALPKGWPRGNTRAELLCRVEITGRPNLSAEVALDYPIAAVRVVNAIPAVVAAAPGILSGAEIAPLASGNVRPGGPA